MFLSSIHNYVKNCCETSAIAIFPVQQDVENEGPEMTDWERYAVNEYESLVAEEAANENWNDG